MLEQTSLVDRENPIIEKATIQNGSCSFNDNQIIINQIQDLNLVSIDTIFIQKTVINSVLLEINPQVMKSFHFSIFYSNNDNNLVRIPTSKVEIKENGVEINFPLLSISNFQINVKPTFGNKHLKLNLKKIQFFKKINIKVSASSTNSRLLVIENILDRRPDYGWMSASTNENIKDEIYLEFNQPFYINAILLKSVKDKEINFPLDFTIEVSHIGKNWKQIVVEKDFIAGPSTWYKWDFLLEKCSKIRLTIFKKEFLKGQYSAKLLDLDCLALPENTIFNKIDSVTYASELIAGVVKLAENNSEKSGFVLQSNDSRIQAATTESLGIVELAQDREERASAVLQSNDSRIQAATTESLGIVELAQDREERASAVLQSNDSRIQAATTESLGIVKLAKNGSNLPNEIVQADDNRLRLANTAWPGIVQLAKHDESMKNLAIQSDDPRLEEGSEEKKGRIQFARTGEVAVQKAIQANDERLQIASIEKAGIVYLAKNGEVKKKTVVQADDLRLSNARNSLPHKHNYAPLNHKFNDHSGHLNIESNTKLEINNELSTHEIKKLPLSVENSEGLSAGFKGGVVIDATNTKALKLKGQKQAALESISLKGEGAVLFSGETYSLKIPRELNGLKNSGNAMLVEGNSNFIGELNINSNSCMAIAWSKTSNEVLTKGDIVSLDKVGNLIKAKSNSFVFGVIVQNASISLGNKKKNKSILVGISGKVAIKVFGILTSGNGIIVNEKKPGAGKEETNNQKAVIAIACESNNRNGENLIDCVLKI